MIKKLSNTLYNIIKNYKNIQIIFTLIIKTKIKNNFKKNNYQSI